MNEIDGFQRRKEQKKNNILDTALHLFKQYGTQKVSVAEIAKQANVSQVTIYNYFGSKHDLIYEVIVYFVDTVWEEYEEMFNSNLPFPEKIKQMIFNKKTDAKDISSNFYHDFMSEYPAGLAYIEQLYENQALPRFLELFDEGKKQGYVDKSISNEAIFMYIQMFREFLLKDGMYEQILPLTEDLTKLFFYGIVGDSEVK